MPSPRVTTSTFESVSDWRTDGNNVIANARAESATQTRSNDLTLAIRLPCLMYLVKRLLLTSARQQGLLQSRRSCYPLFHCGLPEPSRRGMKRATNGSKSSTTKPKPKLPDYTDAEPLRDQDGDPIWPAPAEAIEKAREFIKEWCVLRHAAYSHILT